MKMMRLAPVLFISLACLSPAVAQLEDETPTRELIQDADRVIAMSQADSVGAERQSSVIFQAARRFAKEGMNTAALQYFANGFRVSPWHMDAYLDYATALKKEGKEKEARRWAQTVYDRSEEEAQQERARAWLGLPKMEPLPKLPKGSPERPTVCLLPLGKPSPRLMASCAHGIKSILGMDVYLAEDTLALPQPNRSAFKRWVGTLKEGFQWDNPALPRYCKELGIEFRSTLMPDKHIVMLVEAILRREGSKEDQDAFANAKLAFADEKRGIQWNAALLLETIQAYAATDGRQPVLWLAMTDADIYQDNNNFNFGVAAIGAPFAVVSSARFSAAFNDEPPDAGRLATRVLKQILSSIGMCLKVERPIDPTCPRSYPNSIMQHDAKSLRLCENCREGIARGLGMKELPAAPENPFAVKPR
jgi:predicted Zn-dependent protease